MLDTHAGNPPDSRTVIVRPYADAMLLEGGCAQLTLAQCHLTGTTPEGVQIRVRGCDHWEFREGKVIRKDSYWKIVEKS